MKDVKARIKQHEGYRLEAYKCTEGYLTGGYGHRIMDGEAIPSTKEGWEEIFESDFDTACVGASELVTNPKVNQTAHGLVVEMVFQMGTYGVSKFVRFLKAVNDQQYKVASMEMLDSKWAKQTPERAKSMSEVMANI